MGAVDCDRERYGPAAVSDSRLMDADGLLLATVGWK
jgi:hypothetical protein